MKSSNNFDKHVLMIAPLPMYSWVVLESIGVDTMFSPTAVLGIMGSLDDKGIF